VIYIHGEALAWPPQNKPGRFRDIDVNDTFDLRPSEWYTNVFPAAGTGERLNT